MRDKNRSLVDLMHRHPKIFILVGSLIFGVVFAVRRSIVGDNASFLVELLSAAITGLIMGVLFSGLIRWVAWRGARKEEPATHGGQPGGDRPSG